MDWSEVRAAEFPALQGGAYLDYAYRGLVPQRALARTAEVLAETGFGRRARPAQEQGLARLRAQLLTLLGWEGGAHGLCLTANTTVALASLVGSIPWRRGERVLLHEDEVTSNRLPWEAAARTWELELEVLPSRRGSLDLDDLERACQRPVAWASFAALTLQSGEVRPLGRIAELVRAAGGRLCVDAAQGIGALDLRGVEADALVGCGRKWLSGPPEVGFLAMHEELAGGLRPLSAGGRQGGGGAVGAFEGGLPPVLPALGLSAALDRLEAWGWAAIHAAIGERAGWVREVGQEAGCVLSFPLAAERCGPIVFFDLSAASDGLEGALEARGVWARVYGGRLRVSAHAWTAREELERLFAALRELKAI